VALSQNHHDLLISTTIALTIAVTVMSVVLGAPHEVDFELLVTAAAAAFEVLVSSAAFKVLVPATAAFEVLVCSTTTALLFASTIWKSKHDSYV
jgi:hypothetical protein